MGTRPKEANVIRAIKERGGLGQDHIFGPEIKLEDGAGSCRLGDGVVRGDTNAGRFSRRNLEESNATNRKSRE